MGTMALNKYTGNVPKMASNKKMNMFIKAPFVHPVKIKYNQMITCASKKNKAIQKKRMTRRDNISIYEVEPNNILQIKYSVATYMPPEAIYFQINKKINERDLSEVSDEQKQFWVQCIHGYNATISR